MFAVPNAHLPMGLRFYSEPRCLTMAIPELLRFHFFFLVVPGGPPLDVKAVAVDSQTIRVTWKVSGLLGMGDEAVQYSNSLLYAVFPSLFRVIC